MQPSEARELKQLRDENTQAQTPRRRPVPGQGHAPGRRSKKVLKPVKQREVMRYLMGRYGVSTRRACRVVQATRSSAYYTSRKDPLTALRQRHARAGADARALRLSPPARAAAARRLGGRQRALLSRVHRGGTGLTTQATVAPCDRGASRAATAGDGSQRHLEHGLRRRRVGRWPTIPDADGARSVHARMPGDRRRARARAGRTSRRRSSGCGSSAGCRSGSTATTAPSSSAPRWTCGRTRTASSWISAGAASRPTTPRSNRSTDGFARSV